MCITFELAQYVLDELVVNKEVSSQKLAHN